MIGTLRRWAWGLAAAMAGGLAAGAPRVAAEPGDRPPTTAPAPAVQRTAPRNGAGSAEEAARLIAQLGGARFAERQSAQQRLIEIATPEIVRQIRQAQQSEDSEVRERAGRILEALKDRIAEWASREARKRLAWSRPLPQGIQWPPAGGVGAICIRDRQGAIVALAAADGTERWRLGGSAVAVAGRRAYIVGEDRKLAAVDLATGKPPEGFSHGSGGNSESCPTSVVHLAATADALYLTSLSLSVDLGGDANRAGELKAGISLWAVDAATGKVRWRAELPELPRQAPLPAGKRVLAWMDRQLLAFDVATGQQAWSFAEDGRRRMYLEMLAASGDLVLLAGRGRYSGLEAAEGRALWQQRRSYTTVGGRIAESVATVADGTVYLRSAAGVEALDAANGASAWSHRAEFSQANAPEGAEGGAAEIVLAGQLQLRVMANVGGGLIIRGGDSGADGGHSAPAVAGGIVYFASPDGLHAVDARDGKPLWKLPLKGLLPHTPVAAGGVLYFAARPEQPTAAEPAGQTSDAEGAVVLHAFKLAETQR